MAKKFLDSRYLGQCAARYNDLVYIISKARTLADKETPHSSIIARDRDLWADAFNTAWNSTAIAVAKSPSEKMILVGEDGQVMSYVGGAIEEEKGIKAASMIRGATTVAGLVYACGMKRQVFKRTKESKWANISVPKDLNEGKGGFEAISGFSEEEIYCVGWMGEIWKYDGVEWSLVEKKSKDIILSSVHCGESGKVYAVGQKGSLYVGRNSKWKKVKLKDFEEEDFWGVREFLGKVYVATMTGLYTLEGDKLVPAKLGKAKASSYSFLTEAEGVLWSSGETDLLSFDGKKWVAHK